MKKILCALLALVLVLSMVACGGGKKSKPYADALKIYFDAKLGKMTEKQYKASIPPFYWENNEYLDFEEMWEMEKSSQEETAKYWKAEQGGDLSVSYKVIKEKPYDEDRLDELAESMEEYYDADPDQFKKAYTLTIKYTIKGKYGSEEERTIQLDVMQYDGKWYVWGGGV